MRTDQSIINRYTVTAGVLSYSVTFPLYERSDVAVYLGRHDGSESLLVLDADYSVSINDNQTGGTVVLFDNVAEAGDVLALLSAVPYTQELDLSNVATIDVEATERQMDRTTQQIQQLKEQVERSALIPPTSSGSPEDLIRDLFNARSEAVSAAAEARQAELDVKAWPGRAEVLAAGSTTPRPLQDRFADVVNVKDFGAVGDGVTDDTKAVQAALDSGRGTTVFMPAGVYAISDTLYIHGGTHLIGAGEKPFGSSVESAGVTIQTIGTGVARRWHDISPEDDGLETPMLVMAGAGAKIENVYLATTAWSVGVFVPCVRQCGLVNVTSIGQTKAPLYLDATWSDRHTELMSLHPAVRPDGGLLEWYAHDCYFHGAGLGVIVQGTTRSDEGETADSWKWCYGGTSDMYFSHCRISGLSIDGRIYGNTISKMQFVCCSLRIAGRDTMLSLDNCRMLDFIQLYGESTSECIVSYTSNTTYITFLCSRLLNATVYVDGVSSGVLFDGYTDWPVTFTNFGGRGVFSAAYVSVAGLYPDSETAGIGSSSMAFANVRTKKVQSPAELDIEAQGAVRFVVSGLPSLDVVPGGILPPEGEVTNIGNSSRKFGAARFDSLRIVETGAHPEKDNAFTCGFASRRWNEIFAVNDVINTSDAREKTSITAPDEALMRAWGKVNFKAFQFMDAVEKKGEDARIHFGVIAQQVAEAFASEGLDASRYALFCYDKWEDEYEDVEVVDVEAVLDGQWNEVTPALTHTEKRLVTPAGDRYGIRYSEALALECAYQRWRLDKLEAKLN